MCVWRGEEEQGAEGGGWTHCQTRLSGEQMMYWESRLISDPIFHFFFFFSKRVMCNHLLKSICLAFSKGGGGG